MKNVGSLLLGVKAVDRAVMPRYATDGASGMDLCALIPWQSTITLQPMQRELIPTGLFVQIPVGYEGQIRARSGLSIKHGITLVNAIGTIDSDYRGELKIPIINLGDQSYTIHDGDRIAQLVIAPYAKVTIAQVSSLDQSQRGQGGFGSTGLTSKELSNQLNVEGQTMGNAHYFEQMPTQQYQCINCNNVVTAPVNFNPVCLCGWASTDIIKPYDPNEDLAELKPITHKMIPIPPSDDPQWEAIKVKVVAEQIKFLWEQGLSFQEIVNAGYTKEQVLTIFELCKLDSYTPENIVNHAIGGEIVIEEEDIDDEFIWNKPSIAKKTKKPPQYETINCSQCGTPHTIHTSIKEFVCNECGYYNE